jgi:hypothetical protein
MAHFNDLEAMVYRSALAFVGTNTLIKIGLRKFNGFDALALLLLLSAVLQPFFTHYGYIVEIAISGIMVSTTAYCAGAPRRAMLFLSSIIVFTESLTWSESVIGHMEDVDACSPVNVSAALQLGLLAMVVYAVHAVEEDRYVADDDDESQFKTWIVVIVGACAVRSVAMSYDCLEAKKSVSQLAGMLKTVLFVSACVANGQDETVGESAD